MAVDDFQPTCSHIRIKVDGNRSFPEFPEYHVPSAGRVVSQAVFLFVDHAQARIIGHPVVEEWASGQAFAFGHGIFLLLGVG